MKTMVHLCHNSRQHSCWRLCNGDERKCPTSWRPGVAARPPCLRPSLRWLARLLSRPHGRLALARCWWDQPLASLPELVAGWLCPATILKREGTELSCLRAAHIPDLRASGLGAMERPPARTVRHLLSLWCILTMIGQLDHPRRPVSPPHQQRRRLTARWS